ncbi:hypothetical protein EG329_005282 [Mollisiaceae sp. DMI_Dod_QoI]|nr:hypothetical protein EG329_005282 [Helotiales sp. DMI_Dod_QoI]
MFHSQPEKTIRFSPLVQSEENDVELSDSEQTLSPNLQQRRKPQVFFLILLFIFATCTLLLGFMLGRISASNTSAWATKITQYCQSPCILLSSQNPDGIIAPILDDIPLTYTLTQFNGSFLHENIYRQAAIPAVDAAWEALGINYRALRIPSSLASKSALSSSQVQISSKYGGGYPANVEGLHHLHCLNLVRQALWYNYDYYHALGQGAFKNEEFIVRKHVSHCVDILRQQLMCTVDVGVLGQVWVNRDAPEAFTDFNTRHMCRDFERVRRWAEERQMPETVPEDFLQPPKLGDVLEAIP